MKRALCAAGLLLGQMPAQAYELQTLEVSHQGKAYHVQVQARLARKPERVFAVLTEFERASQLNPSIKSMVVMPEGDALRSVTAASTEVGGVQQGRACGVELGHKGVCQLNCVNGFVL